MLILIRTIIAGLLTKTPKQFRCTICNLVPSLWHTHALYNISSDDFGCVALIDGHSLALPTEHWHLSGRLDRAVHMSTSSTRRNPSIPRGVEVVHLLVGLLAGCGGRAAAAAAGGYNPRRGVDEALPRARRAERLHREQYRGISVGMQVGKAGCSWPNVWANSASFFTPPRDPSGI
jgi:hypothetical protein